MTRILIADTHRLFRDTLAYVLNTQKDMEVVGVCGDSAAAASLSRSLKPDVILIDPGSGSTLKKLCSLVTAKIIAISMYAHPEYASTMLGAGAGAFLTKDAAVDTICRAIENQVSSVKRHANNTFSHSAKI